jgi:excisionase family DNA binding protein
MQDQAASTADTESGTSDGESTAGWRGFLRGQTLRNAMSKRAMGVPTYSVPEAAALMSISQEYLYRLIQAGSFPAVRMRVGGKQGRYVVPAKAIEQLLTEASAACSCVELGESTQQWGTSSPGGAA